MIKAIDSGNENSPKASNNWDLRLYIAGQTPRSVAALSNLKKLCDEYLQGRYSLEVVDLQQNPELASAHQIVATPMLIKELPEPIRRVIGDLSNQEQILRGLDLQIHMDDEPG